MTTTDLTDNDLAANEVSGLTIRWNRGYQLALFRDGKCLDTRKVRCPSEQTRPTREQAERQAAAWMRRLAPI